MNITESPKIGMQKIPAAAAALILLVLIIAVSTFGGLKQIYGVLIGACAGFALYHASFGFTAGWRRVVTEGRGGGLRAQFILILLVSVVSFPLIAYGRDFGLPTNGFVFPVGLGMLFGAFIFGFGMQFGGGCGSGTLFVAGGGSTRMCIALASFVAGSFLGTFHVPWWNSLPKTNAFSLIKNFGPVTGFLIMMLALGAIAYFTIWHERKLHGELETPRATGSLISGPWSPMTGAIALAMVCITTFLLIGRPWGVTWGFALWGAKIANASGIDVPAIEYWSGWRERALENSVFRDTTSVMNFGIMAGALGAAALAAKFKPLFSLSRIEISTAIFGGLLMGYGARLAYGCNIGAYLGGLVSGSLHGWAWMIAAFIGSTLAILAKRKLGI